MAALIAGKTPDPALGKRAKQRSLHNNYLTLPVVLMMISNHYPMMFEHDRAQPRRQPHHPARRNARHCPQQGIGEDRTAPWRAKSLDGREESCQGKILCRWLEVGRPEGDIVIAERACRREAAIDRLSQHPIDRI